jgi:NAD-dependent SIR2 family protein deacetylase
MEQFNLPLPEAVFDSKFFQKEPQLFYKVAKHFISKLKTKPTLAHKFVKKIQENG